MFLAKLLLGTMMLATCVSSRKPDGLVVVSRHGVRRQFPSSTHDFSKYAPGKDFATEDEVCAIHARVWFCVGCAPLIVPRCSRLGRGTDPFSNHDIYEEGGTIRDIIS